MATTEVTLEAMARDMMDLVYPKVDCVCKKLPGDHPEIACVLHTGNMQFRCRVAADENDLTVLAQHMLDTYETLKFVPSLLPPYAETDVAAFEAACGSPLPPLLRIYLLKISRETSCDSYRVTINLTCDASRACMRTNTFVTPAEVLEGYASKLEEAMFANDDPEDDPEEYDDPEDGTLYFSTGGCAFSSYIIVKGVCAGTVMRFDGLGAYELKPLWERLLDPRHHVIMPRGD